MYNEVINQHYVPQFYLRKFGFGKKNRRETYVFDKGTFKVEKRIIKKIASRNHFYDLENTISEEELPIEIRQIFEIMFGDIETRVSKTIFILENRILNLYERKIPLRYPQENFSIPIFREERETLAGFLTFQYFRTKSMRTQLTNVYKEIYEKIVTIHKKNLEIKFSEKEERSFHMNLLVAMFSQNRVFERIFILFYLNSWEFKYNNTNLLFQTSDNPILLHRFKPSIWGIGPATADLITISLSPKIALFIRNSKSDIKYFSVIKCQDPTFIIGLNDFLFLNADREIYSQKDDFDFNKFKK